jgi:hypothetical protein
MIKAITAYAILTVTVSLAYSMWISSTKPERHSVLKCLGMGSVFASIAFVLLFIFVNVF